MRAHGYAAVTVLGLTVAMGADTARSEEHTFEWRLSTGQASYEEQITIFPSASDWEAPFWAAEATWRTKADSGAIFRGGFQYWQTTEDREQWRGQGQLRQQDDMWTWGAELTGEIGYDLVVNERAVMTPYIGLRYTHQEFLRANFVEFDPEAVEVDGDVDENFDYLAVQAALDFEHQFAERVGWYAEGALGYVFFYQADNSEFGSIDGDYGLVADLSLGLKWDIREGQELGVGVTYSLSDLVGRVERSVGIAPNGDPIPTFLELPDNTFERVGAEVRWSIEL